MSIHITYAIQIESGTYDLHMEFLEKESLNLIFQQKNMLKFPRVNVTKWGYLLLSF